MICTVPLRYTRVEYRRENKRGQLSSERVSRRSERAALKGCSGRDGTLACRGRLRACARSPAGDHPSWARVRSRSVSVCRYCLFSTDTHAWGCTHTHTCTHAYLGMYSYLSISTYLYIYVYMFMCVCVCARPCNHARLCYIWGYKRLL